MPKASGVLTTRLAGVLLMALGAFALIAPMAAGRWSLVILGIPLMALSVAEAYATFASSVVVDEIPTDGAKWFSKQFRGWRTL